MGAAGGRRRERLRALLRGPARQEGPHQEAEGPAQGRRRALSRHGRGPRGRGDRLAPARRAEAQGHPGAPDGLPRDHQAGDPGGGREPSRPRHGPRRGPGGPAHPGPALRLRGLPGAVAQGDVGPVGRARAVRGDPAGGRPRARADQVQGRGLLGLRGNLRRRREGGAADVRGEGAQRRRDPGRPGLRLRPRRPAQGRERGQGRSTSTGRGPRTWPPGCVVPTSTSARSSPSRTSARRTRPSAPPRCSRRRAASSA